MIPEILTLSQNNLDTLLQMMILYPEKLLPMLEYIIVTIKTSKKYFFPNKLKKCY